MKLKTHTLLFGAALIILGCDSHKAIEEVQNKSYPEPQYQLGHEQTHNKFSSTIEPVLRVPSGAVIEALTEEASDRQLSVESGSADVANVSFDPIHPITGPVYVEGAQPGDVLAVTLHKIEVGDWGWTGIFPGFGYLADEFTEPYLKTFAIDKDAKTIPFNNKINLPLKPFPGVNGCSSCHRFPSFHHSTPGQWRQYGRSTPGRRHYRLLPGFCRRSPLLHW